MVKDKISAVIVEDEPSALEVLRAYLSRYCPQVEVAGEAHDARQAIDLIRAIKPRLLFLDVELPFGNAFDVLEACGDLGFETIFVTAYSEYALRALNHSAAYYLLKPLSIDELIAAVERATQHLRIQDAATRNAVTAQNFREQQPERRRVVLPTLEGFEVLRMEDIIRLQANGNYTEIHLKDGTRKVACRFLKHYAEILPLPFLRVHKSHIINLDCVRAYRKTGGGYVVLSDKTEVEVSGSYKEELLKHFG